MDRHHRKLARAARMLREASASFPLQSEAHLLTIARAVTGRPELTSADTEWFVFDATRWDDGVSQLRALYQDLVYGGECATALAFWRGRELAERYPGQRLGHDIRLICAVPRANGSSLWLDCETGLPWVPGACLKLRECLSLEEQQARAARDAQEHTAALQAITALKQSHAAEAA